MGVNNTTPILKKIKRLEKIKFYHNKLKIFMKIICMKIILKSKRKWGFSWEFDKDYNEAKKKKKKSWGKNGRENCQRSQWNQIR